MDVNIHIHIDDRLARGVRRLARSRTTWVSLLVVAIGSAVAYAGAPFSPFSSGTVISSSAVNADFQELFNSSWDFADAGIYYLANGSNDTYVGIGTNTPSTDLDVYSPSGASTVAQFGSAGANGTYVALSDNVGGTLNTGASIGSYGGNLILSYGSSGPFVGIGTNNPVAPFHLSPGGIQNVSLVNGVLVGGYEVVGGATENSTHLAIGYNAIQVRHVFTDGGGPWANTMYAQPNGGDLIIGSGPFAGDGGSNLSVQANDNYRSYRPTDAGAVFNGPSGNITAEGYVTGFNLPSTVSFFTKGGNNGTASCDTFCNGPNYLGTQGGCAGAYDATNKTYGACSSPMDTTGKSSITCLCTNF